MALILLRHPAVAAPAGLCYGQLDLPLLDPALPELDTVLIGLEALLAQHAPCELLEVRSSPLQRAQLLAAALARRLNLPLSVDARWQELSFGAWEGLPWDMVPRPASEFWAADVWRRSPPGGETLQALSGRVDAALAELIEPARRPDQAVLLVGHAGPMRVLMARAAGQPVHPPQAMALPFGGLHWLDGDSPGWCP